MNYTFAFSEMHVRVFAIKLSNLNLLVYVIELKLSDGGFAVNLINMFTAVASYGNVSQ